jgi:hypothetical protein
MRQRLTFANLVSCAALFVALSTGGAYAAATLTGADIVDGSLTGVDVQDETIKREDLAKNSVGTGKVIDNDLTGIDIHDDSLKGADVDEATLGAVPKALAADTATDAGHAANADKLGGLGLDAIVDNRGASANTCDPTSTEKECAAISFNPPVNQRFVLVGRFEWYSDTGGGAGLCRVLAGATVVDVVEFGETERTTSSDHPAVAVAVASVGIPAGSQTNVSLRCRETESDIKLDNVEMQLIGGA